MPNYYCQNTGTATEQAAESHVLVKIWPDEDIDTCVHDEDGFP